MTSSKLSLLTVSCCSTVSKQMFPLNPSELETVKRNKRGIYANQQRTGCQGGNDDSKTSG